VKCETDTEEFLCAYTERLIVVRDMNVLLDTRDDIESTGEAALYKQ
jgi:hypothetical protein